MPVEPKVKRLAEKLSEVLGAVGTLAKSGTNTAQNYKFARESDLADMLRPMLAERKLFLHQSVVRHKLTSLYQTRSGLTMWLSTVWIEFVWEDGETGETSGPKMFIGYGADTGDKGIYKALTGCEKYFLMKTFLVATGDDPEADEKVDRTEAAQGAARGSRVASTHRPTRTAQPGTSRGGRSATTSNPQMDELGRLARAAQFNVASLAAFTGQALGNEAINENTGGEQFKAYLEALPAEEMGRLIVALTAVAEPAGQEDADPFEGAATEADGSPYA